MPLSLGPGVRLAARWNRLVETVKTRKERAKTGGKWARYGLKRVNKEGTGGINWQRARLRCTQSQAAAAHVSGRLAVVEGRPQRCRAVCKELRAAAARSSTRRRPRAAGGTGASLSCTPASPRTRCSARSSSTCAAPPAPARAAWRLPPRHGRNHGPVASRWPSCNSDAFQVSETESATN